MINLKVIEIDENGEEIYTLVEHCSLGLELYLKKCIELVNEENAIFKFEFSKRKRFDNISDTIKLKHFILDKNYRINNTIEQITKTFN